MSTSSHLTGVARDGLAWQLLQAMPEAVFLVDCELFLILATNRAGEKLAERSLGDLVELEFSEVFAGIDGGDIAIANISDGSAETPPELKLFMRGDHSQSLPMVANFRQLECDQQTIWMVTVDPTKSNRQRSDTWSRLDGQSSSPSASHIASVRCARDGTIVQCSESISDLFELPEDSEVTVETLLQRVLPADRDTVRERWSRFLADGNSYEIRFRINCQGGELRHVTWAAQFESSIGDESVLVLVHDDTELVRLRSLEAEHHTSIAKLEEIVLSIEGFAWECESSTGVFTYVSSRAEELFGYPESTWRGDPEFFPSIIHPEDREETLGFCAAETQNGTDHAMTYRMIAADGSVRWVRDIVYLARNDEGVVTHLRGLIIDITDEHHLRDQLAQSEGRFHRLFDESPTALIEMDWSDVRNRLQEIQNSGISDLRTWLIDRPEEIVELSRLGRITAVNRSALDLFEASCLDDFNGHVGSIMREESMAALREHVLFRLSGGRTFEADNVNYTFSGERRDVHFTVTAAVGAEESWSRLYSSLVDVTPQRRAKMLRDGQSQVLESLASNNPLEDVLSTLAMELENQSSEIHATVFQTSSDRATLEKVANGSVAEEIVTLIDTVRINDLYDDDCRYEDICLTSANRDVVRNEPERTLPTIAEIIARAIGSCGYECGVMKSAIGPDNQLLGVIAVFHTTSSELTAHEEDVVTSFTDLAALVIQHDQHRRALTLRTDELHSLFESYPDALLRIAPDGTIVERYSGSQLTQLLHLSQETSGQILWHLLPRQDAGLIRTAIENVSAGNLQESINFSVQHDKEQRDFEARFLPIPSSNEQIVILRDITRLKLAELKLEHASEQFRYLFENSPDAIFVESSDGKVLDANQAACDLHRLSRDQLIGQDVLALIPPDDRGIAVSRSNALVTGAISEFESRSLRSDGQVVPVGVRNSTITYNGNPAILLHVRDITQQKNEEARKHEHERQLAHVSRLTMMGQLVAGIAHEIRQPLWSLSTFADVCVESLDRPDFEKRLPQIRDVASKVVSEARRVNAITTRMFSFARKGTAERTVCNIGEVANDAVELTAGRARSSRIKTTLCLDDELPMILCDRVLIEQTFANLLNNAYAAMAAHQSDSREVHIEVLLDAEDHDYITATVRDNGPGLPDGILPEQLFEGFFTTGQTGLGIGLALSRSFVEDHGGAIRAEVSPEGGMEFIFTLRIDGGKQSDED